MQGRRSDFDVVISGMGPAGLASAWEAAKQGKSVFIVSDREMVPELEDNFIRFQRVFLTQESSDYLLTMYAGDRQGKMHEEDEKFLASLEGNLTVGIKDIERYIMRQLKALKRQGAVVEFQYASELASVDMKAGKTTVSSFSDKKDDADSSDEDFTFKYLVCADGTGRHALSLLQKDPSLEEHIEITKDEDIPTGQHIGTYLTISRKDKRSLNIPSKEFNVTIDMEYIEDEERENVGILLFDKQSYEKSQHKRIKCSFAGEISHRIQSIEDEGIREMLLDNYVEQTVNDLFLAELFNGGKGNGRGLDIEIVPESKKHGPAKDKLKRREFETNIRQVNIAAVQIGENRAVIEGDSYRDSFYPVGHGANDALFHAKTFGRLLSGEEGFGIDETNKLFKERADEAKANGIGFFQNKRATGNRVEIFAEQEAIRKSGLKGK